jgi:hypothetical protein
VARSSLVRDLEGSPRLDAESTDALLAQLASDGLIAGDDVVDLTEEGTVFFESLRHHVLGATVNLLSQFDLRDLETTVRTCKAITRLAQEEAESAASREGVVIRRSRKETLDSGEVGQVYHPFNR